MPVHFEYRVYRAQFRQPLATAHGVWREREGVILQLTAEDGRTALGEIAPLPAWGSESLDEALAFCAAAPAVIDEVFVHTIPTTRPCCRFAVETAWAALYRPAVESPARELSIAALLPAGAGAIDAAARAAKRGFKVMKWKVGVGTAASELSLLPHLLERLPRGGRLRLDANASWDLATARDWFKACEGHPVEFIEQPFPVGREQPVLQFANEFSTPIALDETIAKPDDLRRWLDFGWPGLYVIKPSLAGSPSHLLDLLRRYEAEAVFSSAFETAVGARAALLLAARAELHGRAIGFGTIGCFADERLNLPDPGPTLSTKWLARLAPGPLWDLSSQVPHAA
ncbi:MAG: o-succinylbenzoate synthase [Opitutaceae bacterium]